MNPTKLAFLAFAFATFIWSGIGPHDRFTWFLEVFPTILGMPILLWMDKKHKVSTLLFVIFSVHMVILCVGGHYTYAEVPLGFWAQDLFDLGRNHYDRLGHFYQGITPALIAFVILSRKGVVNSKAWIGIFCISLALSFSVFYEFLEWWTAVGTGEAAEAFLGTQGDPWDTQWDMFLAFCGATTSILAAQFIDIDSGR